MFSFTKKEKDKEKAAKADELKAYRASQPLDKKGHKEGKMLLRGVRKFLRYNDDLITEDRHAALLDGLDFEIPEDRRFDIAGSDWTTALAPFRGAGVPRVEADPAATYMLIFTSGTTGEPKAALCSSMRTSNQVCGRSVRPVL